MLLQNSWNFQMCSITCFTLSPDSLSEREAHVGGTESYGVQHLRKDCSSCWPSEVSPLLRFSLSESLRLASDVTTLASVPRSPWPGSIWRQTRLFADK
ncbi:hypothetical protein EYF80_045695 [Liparis tanakae]|uniref:Uncharacterized protein n=1 Tax=Liparis tanakae TaxID=230148 RepID=A0A4Z2FSH5_9TELE|nr:hypothetical protein EYF80_045695 [Liparis tanakae]